MKLALDELLRAQFIERAKDGCKESLKGKKPREKKLYSHEELTMQLDLSPKDWERIAYYLHRLAAKEPLRKMNERRAARRLGNMIADVISKERNKWMSERQRWDKGRLEEFIFKEGKTPEEIAEILGTSPEKVEKVLRRFNLLQIGKKK